MTENAIAKEIVDAAFRVHTTLGPGLLESVYHTVLAYELGRRGLRAASAVRMRSSSSRRSIGRAGHGSCATGGPHGSVSLGPRAIMALSFRRGIRAPASATL